MTNYIPRSAKKNDRFHALEPGLVRRLRAGAPDGEVEAAVVMVRTQKVQALRARRARLPPKESSAAERKALDEGIAAWEQLDPETLLDICRRHAANE